MVLDRISTGIVGLDGLIEGGVPRGFTVLVAGNPGTGKTILTSHFLYAGLQRGENSVYVSFGESKNQFLDNLEKVGMNFIDYEKQNKFKFLDFASVTKEGIGEALEEVLETVRNSKASRMVIDSFSAILLAFNNINEARIALHVVFGKMLRAEGITNMLIAEVPIGVNSIGSGMEEFVADGIIQLTHGPDNAIPSTVRVVKMRGTAIDREPHVSVISEGGMIVYPKESLKMDYSISTDRVKTGIYGLDERVHGGFLRGTTTAVTGASGAGKTTFGVQFLAEAVLEGQKAIFCSLEESPDEVRRLGESIGYDVLTLEKKGLHLMSFSPENQSPDALIAELDSKVQALKPSIVFIDSVTAFEHLYKPEMYRITKRLSYLFRKQGITSIFSILTTQQSGLNLSTWGLSSIFHNIILLRYVEAEAQLKRSMLILKIRASPHDQSILEFSISSKGGIRILGSMTDYVGILSGIAHNRYGQYLKKEQKIENREKEQRQKRKTKFEESQKTILTRAKENTKPLRRGRGKGNKRA
jgi:circadian clock protein KaiC